MKGSSEITVDRKELTVSVYTVDDKVYDGTTAAAGTLKLDGAAAGEEPACEGTFAWTSASAGTATVNVSGIHLTGDWGKNYQVVDRLDNQPAGNEIQPKPLTETMFAAPSDVTYTGGEQKPAVTAAEPLLTSDDYETSYENNINAGEAAIHLTGKGNFTGSLTLHFNILPADFSYSVAGGNVKIGNNIEYVSVSETAAGVNGEQVKGTLVWYADDAYTQRTGEDYVFAGAEGDTVTLYWEFTPSEDETNYSSAPLRGETEFILQEKTVPVLRAESYVKDYDGAEVTLEELTEKASAYDGDKEIKGTWKMADTAPVMKDAERYEVELDFTPEDTGSYAQAVTEISVEIRKLDAVISLQLSTNRITTEDPLPEAELVYSGVLGGESLVPDTKPVFAGMPETAAAGVYTVRLENREEILKAVKALETSENYNVAAGSMSVTLTVTENITILPSPEAPAGMAYRLEMENGISRVPESLTEKFETPEELQEVLFRALTEKQPGTAAENSEVHDVKLYISTDGGRSWIEADETNFPKEGIALTLPYPEGTNKTDYKFVVAHIFTADLNGFSAGDIEIVDAENRENGIRFTLMGLSPICVSWIKTESPDQDEETTTEAPASGNKAPLTGDETNTIPWILLLFFSAGILTVQFKKNKHMQKNT